MEDMKKWSPMGEKIAEIELCKDAEYYIEPCNTKYKTSAFVIKNIYDKNYKNYTMQIFNGISSMHKKILLYLDWEFYNLYDCYKLANIANKMPDNIKDYNDAIMNKNTPFLISKKKLLKNEFQILLENSNMEDFYNYICCRGNMCIAGGYPTLLYHQKKLQLFPESDIDVYILCNDDLIDDSYTSTFTNFILFLDKIYNISSITCNKKSYETKKCGVFDIVCQKLNRRINIICTLCTSVGQLLNDYDASYCKCCIYMNDTYITPDAKMAKDTNITCFYRNSPNLKRVTKAKKLGFTVLNYINEKYTINKQGEKISISIDDAIINFKAIKKWSNQY
jgi:hypothetical protein